MNIAFGISLCTIGALLTMPAIGRSQSDRVKVHFPELHLSTDKGHRVAAIELTATCGSVYSVRSIPRDWSVEVSSPSGGSARLKASAGHGATMLWKLEPWNGGIELNIQDQNCFKIDTVVSIDEGGIGIRKVPIRHDSLRLAR